MSSLIKYRLRTETIHDFVKLHNRGLLNLNPGFQRKSVWGTRDREKLLKSVFDGYPVPSIFLYRREDARGRWVYDVLDGKQRLESIFAYCGLSGFWGQLFTLRYQFIGDDEAADWSWREVKQSSRRLKLLDYKLQVVEVAGDLPEIQDLFVRINSTGKKLSNQERRRAQFISSPILAAAERLARRLAKPLTSDRIISDTQRQRMKDVELLSELLISFYHGGPINKKAAVDAAMSGQTINLHSVGKAAREVVRDYKVVRKILGEIRATRFRNITEFYSLMTTIHQLQSAGCNLSGRRSLQIAERLLRRLSLDASTAQEERRSLKSIRIKPVVRDYLMAVEQGADALGQRQKRQGILLGLLKNVFGERDDRAGFSRGNNGS